MNTTSARAGMPASAGTGEQIGVMHAIALECAAQRPDDVVLPDDVIEARWAIRAIQRRGHSRHPNASSDMRFGQCGTPRAPIRARLPLLPSGPGGVERGDTARGVDHHCTR